MKKIYEVYASSDDITFIMEQEMSDDGNVLYSDKVVGFYWGEPNEEDTQKYIGSMQATYEGGLSLV